MSKLTKEIVDLINDSESIKVLATADEEGNPCTAFKDSLTVLGDGNLAFGEEFEGSQTNVNLVRSIWFNKSVELTVRDRRGTTFQIKGKPYRYVHAGPLFKKFYLAEREKRGPDSELAGVWIITPEEVRNETYEVRKKEEDERHPFFRHFDRESVRKVK
ncbi:MAG: hypothetical protein KKF00_04145 [Proteobacteria bacterium]|nr:hypothetical protein [Pseudomonadota bacterium]